MTGLHPSIVLLLVHEVDGHRSVNSTDTCSIPSSVGKFGFRELPVIPHVDRAVFTVTLFMLGCLLESWDKPMSSLIEHFAADPSVHYVIRLPDNGHYGALCRNPQYLTFPDLVRYSGIEYFPEKLCYRCLLFLNWRGLYGLPDR